MPTESTANPAENVQCPQCQTRFRVTAQQLKLAAGLVRCSVCMSIFNAAPAVAHADDIGNTTEANIAQTEPELDSTPTNDENDLNSEAGTDEKDTSPLDLLDGLSTFNHDFEHHQVRQRPRRWPWLAASFIAFIGLAGQIALSQKPLLFASPAGDYLRTLCPLHPLLCETKAPEKRLLGNVVSTHLLVRKHPSSANALIVDTILLNRDPVASHFPTLQLRFSDIGGQTLASRAFRPSEYLAGELNALSELPSQQPVHVALEIVDPGPQAVNYQLQLLP
ncbi:zinc-ribbon and DUF3426 domain-containing protein [Zhongshania guokunii]|uniref:Zinc-ribbon and DUF3426 domain-containing protein n=1 Tax=Zhongshania guokunii TaxID=641783 RepID=A0ABV3U644_9GAMM